MIAVLMQCPYCNKSVQQEIISSEPAMVTGVFDLKFTTAKMNDHLFRKHKNQVEKDATQRRQQPDEETSQGTRMVRLGRGEALRAAGLSRRVEPVKVDAPDVLPVKDRPEEQ